MDDGVRVGLREIYDKVVDLAQKMDPVPGLVADHETRLRKVERVAWMAAGIAVAAPIVASVLG